MPKTNVARTSFAAGSVTPRLLGRTDLDQYRQAVQDATNVVSTVEGSLTRRPGEEFMELAKYPDQPVVFHEFFVTEVQTYMIEAGPLYFRFWTKNGLLLDNSGVPVEIVTPYTATELDDLQFVQDGEEATVVHVDHEPYLLTRTGVNTFTFAVETYLQGRAPLGLLNFDNTKTVTLSGTYPALTATAAAASFVATDVGRVIFVRDTTNKRALYGVISAFTSTTVVSVTGTFLIGGAVPAGTLEWALGLFSPTYGCRAVAIHEGRKWYGGFKRARDYLTGSVSGSFNNFESISPDLTASSSVNNDKAITRRVSTGGGGSAAIYWMASTLEQLVVGTGTGQYLVQPGVTGILTPLEARALRATGRPQGQQRAIVVDGQVYFTQRGGTRMRRLELQVQDGSYTTTDLSIVSSHLSIRGIRKLAYQQEPWSVMWALMKDGSLVGWTFEKDRAVLGAHRHVFGGDLQGQDARVIAMGILPGENARPNLDDIPGREGSAGLHATDASWSFETATITTDWTVAPAGAFTSATAGAGAVPVAGARLALATADMAAGGGTASLARVTPLAPISGWSTALVDAGRGRAEGRVSLYLPAADYRNSTLNLTVEPLDATNAPIPFSYTGQAEGWPVRLADQAVGQWLALPFRTTLLPAGTRAVRLTITQVSDGQVRFPLALDDVRLNVRQVAVTDQRPPGENEDRVLVCVRRSIAGQQVQHIGFIGPTAARPLPREVQTDRDRAFYVGYLDASLLIDDARPVAWVADDGTALRFRLAIGGVLAAGTEIAMHNMAWQAGDTLSSALNNTPYFLLDASDTPAGFRLAATAGGAPLTVAALGLPALSQWEGLLLERQPVLNQRVRTVGGLAHLESERVTALVDGREHTGLVVQNGQVTLPEAGSIVRVGLSYLSRFQTTPFSLGDPASNSFLGTPIVTAKVSLRLTWSAGAAQVGTPGAPMQPIKALTIQTPANSPPPFISGDFIQTVPTVADGEPSVVIETQSAYPFEVLSLTAAIDAKGM